jgi:hypothetical protein
VFFIKSMPNQYKGKRLRECGLFWPSQQSTGVINDHVEVQEVNSQEGSFSAYLRENYDVAGGPTQKPRPTEPRPGLKFSKVYSAPHQFEKQFSKDGRSRGWRNTSVLVEKVPLEQALARGRETAAQRGLVLYVCKADGKDTLIEDCPDDWAPRIG